MARFTEYAHSVLGACCFGCETLWCPCSAGDIAQPGLAVMTGATSGFGRYTAQVLAAKGLRVIIAARDPALGRAEVTRIKEAVPTANVAFELCDLGSLPSVVTFANSIIKLDTKIACIVNNAGIVCGSAFNVNHLAHFVLTMKLVPHLHPTAHIVTVASVAHVGVTISTPLKVPAEGWEQYCFSKAANVVFAEELARRLHRVAPGVKSVSCHPGVLRTRLWRNNPFGPLQGCFNTLCACKLQRCAGALVAFLAIGFLTGDTGYYQNCCCCCTAASAPATSGSIVEAGASLWAWSRLQISAQGLDDDVPDLPDPADQPIILQQPEGACGVLCTIAPMCTCCSCIC